MCHMDGVLGGLIEVVIYEEIEGGICIDVMIITIAGNNRDKMFFLSASSEGDALSLVWSDGIHQGQF